MKIVMLCDLYDERLQYQENLLAKYYGNHGHDVTVIASTFASAADYIAERYDPSKPRAEYRDGRARIIKLPYSLNALNRLRRFSGVDRFLEKEEPDLVFVHDIHLNLREAAAYRRAHATTRLVLDYHADYSNSASSWASRRLLHGVIRRRFFYRYDSAIDQIYAVVPASATFLHEVYGVPLERIELLPLGSDVDLARQIRSERPGAAIRERLRIPPHARVIFTGGKLGPRKKTNLLVDALARIGDEPEVHLLVVGDLGEPSEYRAMLERAIETNPRIHATGWVEGRDVYQYMDACDFAVFPASQSVLWQQALSMGLPLIVGATDGEDCSYLNRNANLITVAAGELASDSLAARIRQLVTNPEELEARRAGALRTTDELLDYNQIVQQTLGPRRS